MYGMSLHCSFLILLDTTGIASCNDVKYKIPVLVLNSTINPLAYALFKREIKKEFRRLISINMFLKKGNQGKPSTYVLATFLPQQRFRPEGQIPRRHPSSSCVQKSTYSWNIQPVYLKKLISICLISGCMESLERDGQGDVKRKIPEGTAQVEFGDTYCIVVLRYSFTLRVISDILWSTFFGSQYGLKNTR